MSLAYQLLPLTFKKQTYPVEWNFEYNERYPCPFFRGWVLCTSHHSNSNGTRIAIEWYRTAIMEIATSSSPSNAKSLRPRTPLLAASDPVSVRFLCGTETSLNCRSSGVFNKKNRVFFVERGGVRHQRIWKLREIWNSGIKDFLGWNLSERLAMHQGQVSFLKAGCSSVSAPMMSHSWHEKDRL